MTLTIGISKEGSVELPDKTLKKHMVILGSSGSGKTVLSKVIIEEAALNKIPSIVVDPQGDLSSLIAPATADVIKEHGLSEEILERFKKDVKVTIFTPMSSKGIPMCINPLAINADRSDPEEIIPLINEVALSIAKLIGYDTSNDKGKAASAVLYTILKNSYEEDKPIGTFSNLARAIEHMDEDMREEISVFAPSQKDIEVLIRKIKFLTIGQKELMFQFGIPLDIDTLLGKNNPEKTHISIIYLNTIPSQEEKEFFISVLSMQLYQWMLNNPSDKLQCLYYIDEVAPYIPATSEKPMPKPILRLLFKQARKYGVGCMIATQNPGDIDYKSFAQFGTWAIGRLTTKQDRGKVETALKSLSSMDFSSILPKLKPGNFILFSPDVSNTIIKFTGRWLYTEHKTLNDIMVKEHISKKLREEYEPFMIANKNMNTTAKNSPITTTSITEEKNEDNRISDENNNITYPEGKIEKTSRKNSSFPAAKNSDEISDFSEGIADLGSKHFALKYDEQSLAKLVEKHKRKAFAFGPAQEKLGSIKLKLNPILKARVVQHTKMLWKKGQKMYDLLFDMKHGDIILFDDEYHQFDFQTQFRNFFKLTPDQIQIMKYLIEKSSAVSSADIALHVGQPETSIKRKLTEMHKKKVVGNQKNGRHVLWFSAIIFTKTSLKALNSAVDTLSEEVIDGKIIKEKYSVKDIEDVIINLWDNTAVGSTEIIYLPVYEVEYLSKKGTRKVYVNGHTGKVIEKI
jgi:DNA helicase HerA-like ATPase/predicted transcriptional regulator